jgi:hypothetical protein
MALEPVEPGVNPSAPVRRSNRNGGGVAFAITLIALGAVALFANMNLLDVRWETVIRFWPLLLVLLGLDVLIGRESVAGGIVVGLISAGAIAAVVLFGSQFAPPASSATGDIVTGTINETVDAESLKVRLDLSMLPLEVGASEDGKITGDYKTDSRVEPEIDYNQGELTITQPDFDFDPFSFEPFSFNDGQDTGLRLNLPPNVPIDLEVSSGLGQVILDLSDLNITSLKVDAGSGQVIVTLPHDGQIDTVDVKGDLGQVMVEAPGGAALDIDTFKVDSGSGQVVVTLPASGTIGELDVKADLGQLVIAAPGGASLDIGSYKAKSGSGALDADLPANGSVGNVDIEGDLGSVTVSIPGGPGDLTVESLRVNSGSGALTVMLPGKGSYDADIEADLGAVTVTLPDSLEAHIEIDSGLGATTVSSRFESKGEEAWETSGYNGADNKVNLKIESGSGAVTVN